MKAEAKYPCQATLSKVKTNEKENENHKFSPNVAIDPTWPARVISGKQKKIKVFLPFNLQTSRTQRPLSLAIRWLSR